jgi:hypothetical protein
MGQQKAKYRLVFGPWNECQQIIMQSCIIIMLGCFPVTMEMRLNGKDKRCLTAFRAIMCLPVVKVMYNPSQNKVMLNDKS